MSSRRAFTRRQRETARSTTSFSQEGQAFFRNVIEHSRIGLLQFTPNKAALLSAIGGMAIGTDLLISDGIENHRKQGLPVPQCRPGCSACCRMRVSALVPEVFVVAYCVRNLPNGDFIKERIADVVSRTEHLSGAAYYRSNVPCPFLRDDCCSIYPARPFACRGWYSLNRTACRRAHKSNDGQQEIPLYGFASAMAGCVQVGIQRAMKEMGIQADAVHLLPALLYVLENPETLDAWLSGKTVLGEKYVDVEQGCLTFTRKG